MGAIHTSIGELMLEFLTELPVTKKTRSKTVCNNTVVTANYSADGTSSVTCYLHGHRIANLYNYKGTLYIEISLCGYNTHTTRNRLDGVLLGLKTDINVYQKNNPYVSTPALSTPLRMELHEMYCFELRTGKQVDTFSVRFEKLFNAKLKRIEKKALKA